MKRAIIFANGVMNHWPAGFKLSSDHDLIIAADGGANNCLVWEVTPHVIVGDMDSVNPSHLPAFEMQGVDIIRFSSRKDATDLQLALQLALDRKTKEVVILGALGARWDMTLSNVLILTAPPFKNTHIKLLDDQQEIFCLHGNRKITLNGEPGDILSLMPLSQPATGVTLVGLEYPLINATLPLGTTRGVSNVFTTKTVQIEIKTGYLLITKIHSSHGNGPGARGSPLSMADGI